MRFDGLQSTNFTIAKYLAKENEVYYIEHPYSIIDYLKLDKNEKEFVARKKGFRWFSNGILHEKIDAVNILISRLILPGDFLSRGILYNCVRNLNEQVIVSRIKKVIREKKIDDYIFINAYEFNFPTVHKKLNAKLNLYYCVDPIPAYHHKHGLNNEYKVVTSSDIVLCTSKALYNEKKQINANCHFVPNGADIVVNENGKTLEPHDLLLGIKRPIVGYLGAIERRIDYDLLREVISLQPNKSFVFVGPLYKSNIPNWFFEQPNIYFIPPIPYDEVPEMITGFDVCMIPFKKDEFSECIFPLKLFEYLGLGKPVVISDFNKDLQHNTNGLVPIADNATSFSKAIDESLEYNDSSKVKERILLAKENTWQKRADLILKIIDENLH